MNKAYSSHASCRVAHCWRGSQSSQGHCSRETSAGHRLPRLRVHLQPRANALGAIFGRAALCIAHRPPWPPVCLPNRQVGHSSKSSATHGKVKRPTEYWPSGAQGNRPCRHGPCARISEGHCPKVLTGPKIDPQVTLTSLVFGPTAIPDKDPWHGLRYQLLTAVAGAAIEASRRQLHPITRVDAVSRKVAVSARVPSTRRVARPHITV